MRSKRKKPTVIEVGDCFDFDKLSEMLLRASERHIRERQERERRREAAKRLCVEVAKQVVCWGALILGLWLIIELGFSAAENADEEEFQSYLREKGVVP